MRRAGGNLFIGISVSSILLVCLVGCTFARQAVATLQPTSGLLVLDSDKRILYEPGAEGFARRIEQYLPAAISKVEQEQYRPFPKPVEVYICATKESFSHFTGEPQVVRGTVTVKHLFLSAERLKELGLHATQAVLTHELSHLHFQQFLGGYGYSANIPSWFQEGMAENVSGGASMEKVGEAEAMKAILEGRHFRAETTGSFFFPKRWGSYGMQPQMFYRQSFMFVRFLRHSDEMKFRKFVEDLEDGREFGDSFVRAFGISAEQAWENFTEKLL